MNATETTLHSLLLLALLLALPAFVANRVADARSASEGVKVTLQAGLPVGTAPAFDAEAAAPSSPVAFEVAAEYEILVTTRRAGVPA